MSSGERYNGVPTHVPYKAIIDETIFETPRSPILSLYCDYEMKMFKVLMSQWMMFFECKYSSPSKIS